MFFDDVGPGPDAAARDRARYKLGNPLTVIAVRTQLLQRQIERSSALSEQERTAMLDQVAAIVENARDLEIQIDASFSAGLLTQEAPAVSIIALRGDGDRD